ncbi:MAG: DUF2935 domain-containing protein [Heliobacteriaceae bacterium]|nr:DUF2935 domain-containing protein [Heliobacteriaceae bacterium]
MDYRCYGDKFALRLVDEIIFWKHQEKEHTTVIQVVGGADLEPVYQRELEKWGKLFAETEACAVRYMEALNRKKGKCGGDFEREVMILATRSAEQSQAFVQFLTCLLRDSKAGKNMVFQTLVHHIIRESEYFIGIVEGLT